MKQIVAIIINLAIIVLEILGTIKSVQEQGLNVIRFYTENSNYLALAAAIFFVVFMLLKTKGKIKAIPKWVSYLKLMATSCVMLTLIVVIAILGPMAGGYKILLFAGSMLYHHFLCPLLCLFSFILFEEHTAFNKKSALIAFVPTMIYALIIIILNIFKVIEGPYPFLMVYNQPIYMSAIWFVVILGGAYLISLLIICMKNLTKKKFFEITERI